MKVTGVRRDEESDRRVEVIGGRRDEENYRKEEAQ